MAFSIQAQHVGFVPNAGQWEGDFDFRLQRSDGYLFLSATEQRVALVQKGHEGHEGHAHHHSTEANFKGHVYSIRWLGADPAAKISRTKLKNGSRLNYLLGRDKTKWVAGLEQIEEIVYHNIYPNIDLKYFLTDAGVCRFDFIVKPGGDPSLIKWQIKGADQQGLASNNIVLITSVGSAVYSAPVAFQSKQEIEASFQNPSQGNYSFKIGPYNKKDTLIIDPTLIFSTYSGSSDDNFGFSATFGEDGAGYGAGINYIYGALRRGYPTTLGAFQDSSSGGIIDVTISKFSPDGKALVYATYLGGSGNDVPFSLLEGPNKSLIILGNTGSVNFPVDSNGFDTSFAKGPSSNFSVGGALTMSQSSNMFLTVLDSTGGVLLGSTLFGDTAVDANNIGLEFNYGDASRGDITIDNSGNIIVSSYTFSPNLPVGSAVNSMHNGKQDGIVASFSSNLQQLNWARYMGGEGHDACFSLRYTANNRLYVTGGTESDSLSYDTINAYQPFRKGKVDGFVSELNPLNGDVLKWTYTGTEEHDISFFLDFTPKGNLVLFGQTYGDWPTIGDSVWGQVGSAQFLQEFSPDLSQVTRSTVFGDGANTTTDISPTALMVSDCGDIFISGWGAGYPSARGASAAPRNMPTTSDAWRDSTDFGDFYFLRLSSTWQKLEYATYFGQWNNGPDHVDGGSSRFRKDGSIFQAVCSCGSNNMGFPTTADAFEDEKQSNNCNLVVFRFDMEAETVRSDVRLTNGVLDSTCLPAVVSFEDFSFNSDIILVRTPQGLIDTLKNQSFTIVDSGLSQFLFYAIDTTCNIIDSNIVQIFAFNAILEADFSYDYDSCQFGGAVVFANSSEGSARYHWDFGDGDSSLQSEPTHNYSPGTYQIRLIAEDIYCGGLDTIFKSITISSRINASEVEVVYNPCDPEKRGLFRLTSSNYQVFEWYINDQLVSNAADSLSQVFVGGGNYKIRLMLTDTICNKVQEEVFEVFWYDENFELQFPNIFTLNGDGLNDEYKLVNQEEMTLFAKSAFMEIYNRNGQRVFAGDLLNSGWDGKNENEEVPAAVYYYVLKYEDICGNKNDFKGFLHLQR
jgi:gliding motility-associated-like protein